MTKSERENICKWQFVSTKAKTKNTYQHIQCDILWIYIRQYHKRKERERNKEKKKNKEET